MERAADQLDQRLVREGLLEEPDRTRGYGPLGDTIFLVGGDEDQRQSDPFKVETSLDLQSVFAGHLHVKQGTVGPFRRRKGEQEQLTGGKGRGPHPQGAN